MKTPTFYNNAHCHIWSICLGLAMSSLTEIQYLQIELGAKRIHTNESMIFKMFFLHGIVRWTKVDLRDYRK